MASTQDTPTLERPRADPAREHLRELIRQEVAARRPRRIARRTLELLAESAVEPAPGEPAYRIVDRNGEARFRQSEAKAGGAPAEPLTLADLVAELAETHPTLFELAAPEPVAAQDSPASAKPTPDLAAAAADAAAQAARLRDDAARYIELQSAKARVVSRSLAARSSARGRSVAAFAGEALTALRGRAAAWKAPHATPAPVLAPSSSGTDAAGPAPSVPLGDRIRVGTGDLLARARDGMARANDSLDGRWMLGGATAAAVLVAAVVLVGTARDNADPSPTAGRDQAAAPTPPSTQPAPAAPSAETGQSPSPAPQQARPAPDPAPPSPPAEAEPEAPAPQAGEVSGPAEVVDTATLRIGGRLMHLFGVEWVRGGNAADLTRYLAGRPVTCQKAPGSENFVCTVESRDLSEVVLFNGGGRASPEAGPDLVAAEDHARTERLGVWKR